MNSLRQRIRFSVILTASAIVAVSLLAGCVGVRTEGENRPGGERPALPKLDTNAPQLEGVAQEVEDTIVKIMKEAVNGGSGQSLLAAE